MQSSTLMLLPEVLKTPNLWVVSSSHADHPSGLRVFLEKLPHHQYLLKIKDTRAYGASTGLSTSQGDGVIEPFIRMQSYLTEWTTLWLDGPLTQERFHQAMEAQLGPTCWQDLRVLSHFLADRYELDGGCWQYHEQCPSANTYYTSNSDLYTLPHDAPSLMEDILQPQNWRVLGHDGRMVHPSLLTLKRAVSAHERLTFEERVINLNAIFSLFHI